MHMIYNITFTVPNEVWRRGCRKLQSCLKHSKHGTTGYNLSNNACLLLLRTVNCVSPWLVSTLSLSFFFLTCSLTMSSLFRGHRLCFRNDQSILKVSETNDLFFADSSRHWQSLRLLLIGWNQLLPYLLFYLIISSFHCIIMLLFYTRFWRFHY